MMGIFPLLLLTTVPTAVVGGPTYYLGVLTERTFSMVEGVAHLKRALKHVDDFNVFGGLFSLDFIYRDTALEVQTAMAATLELAARDDVIGIIGSPEMSTAGAIAQLGSLFQLPVLSSEAATPKLVDKTDMPYLFRSQGSDSDRIRAVGALCAHFNWLRVAALTSDDEDGYAKTEILKEQLDAVGAVLTASVYYAVQTTGAVMVDRLGESMRALKFSGCKVTVFLGNPSDQHLVIENIGQFDFDDMQFIHIGTPSRFYSTDSAEIVPLDAYMEGWLFIISVDDAPLDDVTYPGYEASALEELYLTTYTADTTPWDCSVSADPFANFNTSSIIYDAAFISGYPTADPPVASPFPCIPGDGVPYTQEQTRSLFGGFYDAAWVYALALKRMLDQNATLQDMRTNGAWLRDELLKTDWFGLRGHVVFDQDTQDLVQGVIITNMQQAGSSANYKLVQVLEPTPEYSTMTTSCPNAYENLDKNGSSVCLQTIWNTTTLSFHTITWPPTQPRAVPLDGREVSAEKCSFDSGVVTVYRRLGAASVKVHLLSNFEELPLYGTVFDVEIYDAGTIAWNGTHDVPAQNQTVVPFEIPSYGDFTLIVKDHYSGVRVENLALPLVASEPDCASGFVWSEGAGACEGCPQGKHAQTGECVDCPPGRYRGDLDVASCLPCEESTYAPNSGSVNCTSCPANSIRYEYDFEEELYSKGLTAEEVADRIGVNKSQCMCRSGFYASTGARTDAKKDGSAWGDEGVPCDECPSTGGECQGKGYPPTNEKDFWGDRYAKSAKDFQKCQPGRCLKNYECERGFRGRLCAKLKQGKYFSVGGYPPSRCFEKKITNALFFSVAFSLIFALWIWVNLLFGHYSVSIFLTHVQFIAIVAHFKVDFSAEIKFKFRYSAT